MWPKCFKLYSKQIFKLSEHSNLYFIKLFSRFNNMLVTISCFFLGLLMSMGEFCTSPLSDYTQLLRIHTGSLAGKDLVLCQHLRQPQPLRLLRPQQPLQLSRDRSCILVCFCIVSWLSVDTNFHWHNIQLVLYLKHVIFHITPFCSSSQMSVFLIAF